MDSHNLKLDEQVKQAEEFALKLFKACPSESELLSFAKQTGMVVHRAEPSSPLGTWMKDKGMQGLAVYPKSIMPSLSPEAIQHFAKQRTQDAGFEILEECDKNQKPLILLLNDTQTHKEFSLYVLQHEIFHMIQQTLGNFGVSATNYRNESLASSWHLDLLKKLRNRSSQAAQEVILRAEANKQLPVPEPGETFGEGLRNVTSLDLQTYQFFCKNATTLKLPEWIKRHNQNLLDIYQTIKLYSLSPDLNTGLSSVEMRRS